MSSTHATRDWRGVWPIVVLVMLSLPIIFFRLGSYSLVNGDEGFYHYVARHMLETGNWFRLEFTGEHRVYDTFMNAPSHYWAKAVIIALLGDSYWSMRILSALCGLATVLVTYGLGAHIAGRWAGFLAGLLQLTTLQFVYLHGARTGEMDAIIALLYTLAAFTLLRSMETGRWFFPHFICVALLANMKIPLICVPLAADVAFLALARMPWRRWRSWALAGVIVLPLSLTWHIGQAIALGGEFTATLNRMADQAAGTGAAVNQPVIGPLGNALFYAKVMLFGAFPVVLAYPLALVGILAARVEREQRLRHYLLALYPLAVLGFFVVVGKHHPWYIMPAYPFLSILLAVWLTRQARAIALPAIVGLAVVLTLTVCVRVEISSFNPFAAATWLLDGLVAWRDVRAVPPWLGIGIGTAVLAGVLWGLRLTLPKHASRAITIGIAAILVTFAGVRVLVPLKYATHQSEMAMVCDEIDAARARGAVFTRPIALEERAQPLKLRYYFGDEFDIVAAPAGSGASVLLVPK